MTSRETAPAGTSSATLRRTRAGLLLTTAAVAIALPGIGQANTTSVVSPATQEHQSP